MKLPEEPDWPRWMRIARDESKVREIRGPGMNPRIAEYYAATRGTPPKDDTVPWCSAFACWVMEEAGFVSPRSRAARSWVKWGSPLLRPQFGAIIVFERGKPELGLGHVGFYAGQLAPHRYWLLGGNQGDAVGYAVRTGKVLAVRWPSPDDAKP